jgi:hypothetical protein
MERGAEKAKTDGKTAARTNEFKRLATNWHPNWHHKAAKQAR